MNKLGFPPKLVKLCRILNNKINGKVKISKNLSSELKLTNFWEMEMQLLLCCLK